MFCKICGDSLLESYSKEICRKCLRKGYVVKIINKLLKHVDPGFDFKKKDLISLGYNSFEVNDYIWTLIEYDLLIEENKKYALVKKEILDEFIEKNSNIVEKNSEKIIKTKHKERDDVTKENKKPIKLNKVCQICNENLPVHNFAMSIKTEDGLNKHCKKCSKRVTVVKYLNKLLSIVNYGDYFSYNDLKTTYTDSFEFDQHIWSIQENDLIIQENDKYILEDENKINEFLDKYKEFIDETRLSYSTHAKKITDSIEIEIKNERGIEYSKSTLEESRPWTNFSYDENFVYDKELFNNYKNIYNLYNYKPNDYSLLVLLKNSLKQYLKNGKCDGYGSSYKDKGFNNQIINIFNDYFSSSKPHEIHKKENLANDYLVKSIENHIDYNKKNSFSFEDLCFKNSKPISGSKYNEIIHNEILNYIKLGYDIKTIGDLVGLSRSTIKDWLNKGKDGKYPYVYFFTDYLLIIKELLDKFIYWIFYEATKIYDINIKIPPKNRLINRLQEMDKLYMGTFNKSLFIIRSKKDIDSIEKNIKKSFEQKSTLFYKLYQKNRKLNSAIIDLYLKFLKNVNFKEEFNEIPICNIKNSNYQSSTFDSITNQLDTSIGNEFFLFEKPEVIISTKYNEVIHSSVLNYIKSGHSLRIISDLVGIDPSTIKNWINKGKKRKKPYVEFYQDYILIFQDFLDKFIEWFINISPENYKLLINLGSKTKFKKMLEKIDNLYLNYSGKSFFIINSEKDIKLIEKNFGKLLVNKNSSFYKYYASNRKILGVVIDLYIKFLKSQDFKQNTNKNIFDEILSYANEGYDFENISELLNLNLTIIENWLKKGKDGIAPFTDFYNDYINLYEDLIYEFLKWFVKITPESYRNRIKLNSNDKLKNKLDKIDKKYLDNFKRPLFLISKISDIELIEKNIIISFEEKNSIERYNRDNNGIIKELIDWYIIFLKSKDFKNDANENIDEYEFRKEFEKALNEEQNINLNGNNDISNVN